MPKTKPIASISLDLDDKWTYMKTHGDPRWESHPSYLETVIPRILTFLESHRLTITFFIVGQDAAIERNRRVLKSIADAGHEIANHSFHHEPWLHLYTKEQIEQEISSAEAAIESVTGKLPRGFRGPGFSISQQVIETLISHGYDYDASTLPTFIGPLARAYYFFTAKLDAAQRAERKQLFGSLRDGFRSLKAHKWPAAAGNITELPVTTVPIFRTPFHLSYLLYLSAVSPALSSCYLSFSLLLCRLFGVRPSFLLHSLDFAGRTEAEELAFFPGMALSLDHKMKVADATIGTLARYFDLVTTGEHVSGVLTSARAVGPSKPSPVNS